MAYRFGIPKKREVRLGMQELELDFFDKVCDPSAALPFETPAALAKLSPGELALQTKVLSRALSKYTRADNVGAHRYAAIGFKRDGSFPEPYIPLSRQPGVLNRQVAELGLDGAWGVVTCTSDWHWHSLKSFSYGRALSLAGLLPEGIDKLLCIDGLSLDDLAHLSKAGLCVLYCDVSEWSGALGACFPAASFAKLERDEMFSRNHWGHRRSSFRNGELLRLRPSEEAARAMGAVYVNRAAKLLGDGMREVLGKSGSFGNLPVDFKAYVHGLALGHSRYAEMLVDLEEHAISRATSVKAFEAAVEECEHREYHGKKELEAAFGPSPSVLGVSSDGSGNASERAVYLLPDAGSAEILGCLLHGAAGEFGDVCTIWAERMHDNLVKFDVEAVCSCKDAAARIAALGELLGMPAALDAYFNQGVSVEDLVA